MAVQREVASLLRSAGQGSGTHLLRSPWISSRKLAAFVYVAEQYGYRYDRIVSSPTASAPALLFRRLPDAADRANRTARAHPDAHRGGRLPGMRPGRRRLVPLPEVGPEVDLLFARFRLDATEKSYVGKRRRQFVVVMVLWIVIVAVAAAFHADSVRDYLEAILVIDGVLVVLLIVVLSSGKAATRRTRERAGRLLGRTGVAPGD
ncbi:hypothetical protein O7599_31615 [Streptomyces sp. WMMC500]|uniref:hypothetical protein n=1 Tax=Streptomyces sp. WMMC500 TaxID=3015154 RepID=UPI00248D2E1A|nr:hypothetical protein [Streptomyces sp. WMMC500]WBB60042.1 hypothetical protein O7599_31615 [Streptomyces sp. WMMC500]